MTKYIIDTGDYLFTTDGVLVVGFDCDNKPATFYNSLDNLEELNSDYINENFGELQEEAYQKGINDGSLDVKQRVEGAYQRGLEDAWEAARKLFSSMADSDIEKAFPTEWNNGGFKALMNLQPQEAIAKLKAYEDKQKAENKIKVGDVVTHKSDSVLWKAVCIQIDGDHMYLMGHTGAVGCYTVDDFKKTGKHYDIQSILEAMRT